MGCNSSCFIDPYYTTLNGYYGGTDYQIEEFRKRNPHCRQMIKTANNPDKCFHHRMLAEAIMVDDALNPTKPPTNDNFCDDSDDDMPYNAFANLNVGNDLGDKAFIHTENNSHGYYSETNGSGESNPSYDCVRTQDTNCLRQEMSEESPESTTQSRPPSDDPLDMEMYLLYRNPLLPKTSSPILQRRNPTNNFARPTSETYQLWSEFLDTTPTYMLNTIRDIPEAIAGHFCPLDFPGFTDVKECMDSPAARRFRANDNLRQDEAIYENQPATAMNVTHNVTIYENQSATAMNVTHTVTIYENEPATAMNVTHTVTTDL